jgi:hypothetical protein
MEVCTYTPYPFPMKTCPFIFTSKKKKHRNFRYLVSLPSSERIFEKYKNSKIFNVRDTPREEGAVPIN